MNNERTSFVPFCKSLLSEDIKAGKPHILNSQVLGVDILYVVGNGVVLHLDSIQQRDLKLLSEVIYFTLTASFKYFSTSNILLFVLKECDYICNIHVL